MRYINYEFLKNIHTHIKPYRGSDRYPMWDRAHRHKYMIPVTTDDGKTEYHVCYYWCWDKKILDEAEYLAIQDDAERQKYTLLETRVDGSKIYYAQDKKPHVLAIVRDDNTIEFVAKYLNQGERYYLSQLSNGQFWSDVRKGGVLYRDYYVGKTIPIFKNLRIHTDTLKAYEGNKYEVVTRRVDRKKAKQAMQDYAEPMKLAEVMFKAMSKQAFYEIAIEQYNLVERDKKEFDTYEKIRDEHIRIGTETLKTDELAGCASLILSMPYSGLNWRLSNYINSGTVRTHDDEPIEYFNKMRNYFKKMLYLGTNAFVEESHNIGDRYPSSIWKVTFLVNDKPSNSY